MNFSKIKENALKYLGYHHQTLDEKLNNLIDECIEVEKRSHYYSHIDMTKATIFDAVASSFLEVKCNEYEDEQLIGKRTFRFCPGYGRVPIELNKELAFIIESSKKIGLTVQESNILLPQKSMIGLIGLGDNRKEKTCQNCLHIKDCNFRKRGQTCYAKD